MQEIAMFPIFKSYLWNFKLTPKVFFLSNHMNEHLRLRKYACAQGRNVMEESDNIVRKDFHKRDIQNSLPYSTRHANIYIWMTTRESMKIDFPPSTSYSLFIRSFKNILDHISKNLVRLVEICIFALYYISGIPIFHPLPLCLSLVMWSSIVICTIVIILCIVNIWRVLHFSILIFRKSLLFHISSYHFKYSC